MISARTQRIAGLFFAGEFRRLWYPVSIRLRHIDLAPEEPEQFGLSREVSEQYSDSGGPTLESVLARIQVPSGSRIIDFGCGKGGAVSTMARFPFDEVVGIDISARLIHVARQNAQRLAVKATFLCADATTFTDLDRFTHAYFFNPFPKDLISRVYANLLASVARRPRTMALICKYPEQTIEKCFPQSEHLILKQKLDFRFSHPFYIFDLVP